MGERRFMRSRAALLAAALVLSASSALGAHFRLLEPASWIVENERGDPQKAGPCGVDPKGTSTPSGVVS